MTEKEALKLLREHGPMTATEFARYAWPDSEGWRKSKQIGNRNISVRGVGMARAALGMLGRMKHKGLVVADYPDSGATLWKIRP